MVWMEVQRAWVYLESIFKGCDDISQQLPADAHRFHAIDTEFQVCVLICQWCTYTILKTFTFSFHVLQELMLDSTKTKNVIEATNKSHLFEKLEDLQKRFMFFH